MRTSVTFPSNGLRLAGDLYTPDRMSGQLPAVVVGHPWGGVKEQTAGLYARSLAERGFAALAFDAAFQGESEGEPRFLENPFQRAEDVKAAVSYLSTLEGVDQDRIGALGICTSGGYVPFAAQTDHRIRAVATVSAVDMGALMRDGLGGDQDPGVFADLLAQAGPLRTGEALGEPARLAPITAEQVEATAPALAREGYDYYLTDRGRHPRAANRWVMRSVDHIASYDSFAGMERLAPRPLLMIAGSEADTAYFTEQAIEKAAGPKELVWIKGASHFDLYDRQPYVGQALDRLADFFGRHLHP